MNKTAFFEHLGGFLKKNPNFIADAKRLAEEVSAVPGDEVAFSILQKVSRSNTRMYDAFCGYVIGQAGENPPLFAIRDDFSEDIKERLRAAAADMDARRNVAPHELIEVDDD